MEKLCLNFKFSVQSYRKQLIDGAVSNKFRLSHASDFKKSESLKPQKIGEFMNEGNAQNGFARFTLIDYFQTHSFKKQTSKCILFVPIALAS